MIAHQLEQKRLLVGGVEVERTGLHADLRRDLAHGDGGEPMPREKPQRRRPDLRPGDIAVTALFSRHGPTLSERAFNSTVPSHPPEARLDSWTAGFGLARVMGRLSSSAFGAALLVTACGPDIPQLDARIDGPRRAPPISPSSCPSARSWPVSTPCPCAPPRPRARASRPAPPTCAAAPPRCARCRSDHPPALQPRLRPANRGRRKRSSAGGTS
jgi:hypothetical protein